MYILNAPMYSPLIRRFRQIIFWFTALFAVWYQLFLSNWIAIPPTFLLLSSSFDWTKLWQPITSWLTIPYPGIHFSPLFDLFLINLFLTPIASFVHSYLGTKNFLYFLAQLTIVGSACFVGIAHLFGTTPPPCSSFSGVALALIVFWTLLHSKGRPFFLAGIPISRFVVLLVAVIATTAEPLFAKEWARLIMMLGMALSAYLWGVGRWRLRSHIAPLTEFESLISKISQRR